MCILGEPTEGKVVLGALRLALAADLARTATSSTPRSARAGATENSILRMRERARRGARVDPDLGGRPGERLPRRARRSSTSARSRAASAGASRGRRTAPTSSSTCACRRRSRWRVARREVLDLVRSLAERFPDYGVEAEVYVTAPGRGDRRGSRARAGDRRGARGGLRRAAGARRDALVLATRRCSRATASRPSTTARRPGCSTPSCGENLEIDGLVKTAQVYALVAQRSAGCG